MPMRGGESLEWYFLHENPFPNGEAPCSQATFRPIRQRILIWVTH